MSLPRGIVDPNRTPRPHLDPLPEDDHPEAVPPSSLDIVFSFARSQYNFYGSQLPSSPSFVRYQDPEMAGEYFDTDDEDEDDDDWQRGHRPGESSITDPLWSDAGDHTLEEEEEPVSDDEDAGQRRASFGGPITDGDNLTPMPLDASHDGRASYGFPSGPSAPDHRQTTDSSEPSPVVSPRSPAVLPSSLSASPNVASGSLRPDIHFALPAVSPRQLRETSERTPLLTSGGAEHPRHLSVSLSRRASAISHRSTDSATGGRQGGQSGFSTRTRRGSIGTINTIKQLGKRSKLAAGTSTFGQTLFNAIACLVGVGLLSEALAFSYAGWVGGTALLLYFAFLTNHTAKLLAGVIRTDPTLHSYSDISRKAFGPRGLAVINFLFCMELFSVAVALMVLLGDTLAAALGIFSANIWKVIGLCVILPTVFLPLRLLSFTSLIGVMGTFTLLISVLIDSLVKAEYPGSIRDPAPTSLGPMWSQLPLSFGLLLAGFSGHAVVPSLARDMAEPERFDSMIDLAYIITTGIYMLAGGLGYLMWGNDVSDEITKDLARTPGFPPLLNQIALWTIVLNPVTKFALATRPVNMTLESLLGLELHSKQIGNPFTSRRSAFVWIERTVLTLAALGTAVILPNFDRLMAFLGSFSAFLICAIIPLQAHSILIKKSSGAFMRDRVLFLISVVMMVIGTIWVFAGKAADEVVVDP